MAEIKIERRVKYAGDVFAALVDAGWEPEAAGSFLNSFPDAADVAPVKRGRWIEDTYSNGTYDADCSICGESIKWNGCKYDFNYCPNCGAKMDGAKDG